MRWLVPYLAYAYLMLVGATTRVRVHGEEHKLELRKKDRRFIYAFWHNRQIFFGVTHRNDGNAVLVSRSRDGELVCRLMALLDIAACRGSSSRGSVAGVFEMMKTFIELFLDSFISFSLSKRAMPSV